MFCRNWGSRLPKLEPLQFAEGASGRASQFDGASAAKSRLAESLRNLAGAGDIEGASDALLRRRRITGGKRGRLKWIAIARRRSAVRPDIRERDLPQETEQDAP